MLHEQLKHCHNFISFLNRVNDGDDLRFSGNKFQSWLAFEFNRIRSISFRGRYVSFDINKLSCIMDICSGRENFVHYFRRTNMNIFVYFG